MPIDDKRLAELEEKERKYEKMKDTAERARKRRDARIKLTLKKAEEAGLSVSDKEVDDFLKKQAK